MLTNEYLYGTSEVPKVPSSICEARIELLKANLSTLTLDDNHRILQVHRAIKFWEAMKANSEGEDR